MKLSDLYGMTVESEDKKQSGTVIGINLRDHRVKYLRCCDGEEREFLVDVEAVRELGEKIVYAGTKKILTEDNARAQNGAIALGRAVYSESGKFLGHLQDVECNGFTLRSAFAGDKKYAARRLVFGDAVIVKGAKKRIPPAICLDKRNKNEADGQQTEMEEKLSSLAKDLFIGAVCEQ